MVLLPRRRFLALAGAAILGACTSAPASSASLSGARPDSPYAANARLGIWPDVVAKASIDVRRAYEYAAGPQQSLQYIPCYCGCGASGHKDNLGCYVQRFANDGWVIVESHATGCGTCVGITLDVIAMERQGETIKDIRRMIDTKWSKLGPSTPTRLPL